ncbi:MAG: hypothetical protein KDD55_02470 [Bdellovibrionales bacterium]|nr:hypothetical protein [Bdellovibrionales bacterium]
MFQQGRHFLDSRASQSGSASFGAMSLSVFIQGMLGISLSGVLWAPLANTSRGSVEKREDFRQSVIAVTEQELESPLDGEQQDILHGEVQRSRDVSPASLALNSGGGSDPTIYCFRSIQDEGGGRIHMNLMKFDVNGSPSCALPDDFDPEHDTASSKVYFYAHDSFDQSRLDPLLSEGERQDQAASLMIEDIRGNFDKRVQGSTCDPYANEDLPYQGEPGTDETLPLACLDSVGGGPCIETEGEGGALGLSGGDIGETLEAGFCNDHESCNQAKYRGWTMFFLAHGQLRNLDGEPFEAGSLGMITRKPTEQGNHCSENPKQSCSADDQCSIGSSCIPDSFIFQGAGYGMLAMDSLVGGVLGGGAIGGKILGALASPELPVIIFVVIVVVVAVVGVVASLFKLVDDARCYPEPLTCDTDGRIRNLCKPFESPRITRPNPVPKVDPTPRPFIPPFFWDDFPDSDTDKCKDCCRLQCEALLLQGTQQQKDCCAAICWTFGRPLYGECKGIMSQYYMDKGDWARAICNSSKKCPSPPDSDL